jgi:hypothetical protein
MDSSHAPYGIDAVGGPGFTLAGGQAHPIERRGDMLVRPTPGHAAHHCQRILICRAAVLAGSWLANTQI